MIDVALCFSDSDGFYYRKASTTMLSVFANTTSPVRMHIVHDETLTPEKQTEMKRIAASYSQDILFHAAPAISNEVVSGVPVYFGRGTLYRLFLHNLIEADKVIYLDCDIICELDITDLYRHELGALPMAAVRDYGLHAVSKSGYEQSIGISPSKYFNAGVLLLNMHWFREHGDELLRLMVHELSHNTRLKFADQDVLNIFFNQDKRGILYLEERFNYLTGFADRPVQDLATYKNKILHLTNPKPWKIFTNAALFYWKYYSKTPWGANAFEEMLKTGTPNTLYLYSFILDCEGEGLGWLRRYYDCKTMGLLGYLKKRIFKKRHP